MIGHRLIFDMQSVTYYEKLAWVIYAIVIVLVYKNQFAKQNKNLSILNKYLSRRKEHDSLDSSDR
jgi:hypothetical protein